MKTRTTTSPPQPVQPDLFGVAPFPPDSTPSWADAAFQHMTLTHWFGSTEPTLDSIRRRPGTSAGRSL